jgi:hypothetical protein
MIEERCTRCGMTDTTRRHLMANVGHYCSWIGFTGNLEDHYCCVGCLSGHGCYCGNGGPCGPGWVPEPRPWD